MTELSANSLLFMENVTLVLSATSRPLGWKDGGFCPATTCPSGWNRLREAWTEAPNAPDLVAFFCSGKWARSHATAEFSANLLTVGEYTTPVPSSTRRTLVDTDVRFWLSTT